MVVARVRNVDVCDGAARDFDADGDHREGICRQFVCPREIAVRGALRIVDHQGLNGVFLVGEEIRDAREIRVVIQIFGVYDAGIAVLVDVRSRLLT